MKPELGDSTYGDKIGRTSTSKFWYVDCPSKTSPDCLGERWTSISTGRYASHNPDHLKQRVCKACDISRKRAAFKLPRPRTPSRPF